MSWSTCPKCGHNQVESLETPGYGICRVCGHDSNEEPEYLSTCCSEPKQDDTDICSRCGEHATYEDEYGNELEEI